MCTALVLPFYLEFFDERLPSAVHHPLYTYYIVGPHALHMLLLQLTAISRGGPLLAFTSPLSPVLSRPPTSRRHPAYCAFSPAQLSVRRRRWRPHRTNWLDAAYAKQSHLKNVLNLSSDRVCITPRTPLSCLNFTTQCSSCTLARVLHMHISFFLKLVAFLRARSSFWNSSNQVQVAIKCWAVVSYVNT